MLIFKTALMWLRSVKQGARSRQTTQKNINITWPHRILLVLLLILLAPQTGLAHKLRVFAWAENGRIYGETVFQRGAKARNVAITLEDVASREKLATTTSNEKGLFSFPIPEVAQQKKLDLRIIADAGDGHRNEWFMKASEYGISNAATQQKKQPDSLVTHSNLQNLNNTAHHIAISETALRNIVREEVAAQLGGIRQMIVRHSGRRISLQDILGGLGYIIGIVGFATYIIYRKEKRK